MENLPDLIYPFIAYISENFFYLRDALIGNSNIRPWQACKIETAIQNCKSFASKLFAYLFIIYNPKAQRSLSENGF